MVDSSAQLLLCQKLRHWVDRNGELLEIQEFSIFDIQDLGVVRKILLGSTDLVKYWNSTPDSYHGLYLKDKASRRAVVLLHLKPDVWKSLF